VQFFASLAEASLSPYFGDAGGDSTSDLLTNSQVSSHCSFFFFFFFFFLIRGATFPYGKKHDFIYLFNFNLLYFFFPMRKSSHHLCPTDHGEKDNNLGTKSAKKAPPTTPKKANMQGKV